MVILGGLELVAAGYILNELKNDKKEREQKERERKDRRHDHKHHNQHGSPPRMRPQQNLLPPQDQPPRPHSAPPPGHPPPMWQSQPIPYPPQQWQPQPQHAPYTPSWQPQPLPQPQPQPQPQGYIDLKTGKVQQNMYPPDHPLARSMVTGQEQGQHYAADYNRPRGEFNFDAYGGPPPPPGMTTQHTRPG